MDWLEFAAAFAAFFATHSVPIRPPMRPWLQARLGARGFALAYSALSLAVLAWLIGAAARAPFVPLWDPASWQTHLALTAMLPVCLILALAVGRPNPFSFGGAGHDRFDPARAGIVGLMRHPLLVALAIWAGVHLLANGALAHALLFGTFAGFALLGMGLVDRRKRREMGADWGRLNAARRAAPADLAGAAVRLAAGAALYAALLWLHPVLFGVNPLP